MTLRSDIARLEISLELTEPVGEEFVRSFVSSTAGEAVPADFVEEQVRESLKVPAHVWRETL